MSETDTGSDLPAACPSCGAAVRHDVPWCLQCYASLRPEPEPEPEPAPEPEQAPNVDSATGSAGDGAQAGAVGGAHRVDLEGVADRMLAELSTSSTPLPGWWSRVPTSGGAKAAWVGGGIAVAALGILLVLGIVGVFI